MHTERGESVVKKRKRKKKREKKKEKRGGNPTRERRIFQFGYVISREMGKMLTVRVKNKVSSISYSNNSNAS